MTDQRYPKGWNSSGSKTIRELGSRSEEEWVAADEAASAEVEEQSLTTVPMALMPEIRRLFSKVQERRIDIARLSL